MQTMSPSVSYSPISLISTPASSVSPIIAIIFPIRRRYFRNHNYCNMTFHSHLFSIQPIHIKAMIPAMNIIGTRMINSTAPTIPINSPTLVSSQVSMPPHMKYCPSSVSGSITLSQHFPLYPYICCRLFTASSSVSLRLRTYFTPPPRFSSIPQC